MIDEFNFYKSLGFSDEFVAKIGCLCEEVEKMSDREKMLFCTICMRFAVEIVSPNKFPIWLHSTDINVKQVYGGIKDVSVLFRAIWDDSSYEAAMLEYCCEFLAEYIYGERELPKLKVASTDTYKKRYSRAGNIDELKAMVLEDKKEASLYGRSDWLFYIDEAQQYCIRNNFWG